MQKIKVSKETHEKIQKVFFTLVGSSIGLGIGAIVAYRADKKAQLHQERLVDRWKFLVYTTGQMIEIENDVTMSGIERQQKVYELQKFLELVVEQELM